MFKKKNDNSSGEQPPKGMMYCKTCGELMAKNAKRCPHCGAKNKKPLFKRVWFWLLIVFVLVIAVLVSSSGANISGDEVKKAQSIAYKDFKKKCKTYKYKNLMRNPDQYKGKYVKFVAQISQDAGNGEYLCLTKGEDDSKQWGYFGDRIYLFDQRKDKSVKLLEDDFVTIYGLFDGTKSYTTILGTSNEVPEISAIYIDIDN